MTPTEVRGGCLGCQELELQMVMNHHLGTGNRAQVLEEQIVPFSQCAISLARLFKDSKRILSVCLATIGHRSDTQEFKNPGV